MEGNPRQSPHRWRLSLILPAYNEEAVIAQAIAEAERDLSSICIEHEIIVVDDGSEDGTASIVALLASKHPRLRLLRHSVNRGYGAALRTGFEAAKFDRVAFTDADCQFHLVDLAELLVLTQEYDIAAGYRIERKDPWRRKFLSWGYNLLARALLGTGVRDCDCALKVFRRETAMQLLPEASGFFVNTEMLARAKQAGFSVVEHGVRHRPRQKGKSKVSLSEVPHTLAALLPFWWTKIVFCDIPRSTADHRALDAGWPEMLGHLAMLVIAAGVLFFGRLNSPLQEPEESRYADIPRQMLASGHYAAPKLNNQSYYDKPPLLYWLCMASYGLFGVHDWSARLASAGSGFLTVFVVYFWSARALGTKAAFWSAMMLCLSGRFLFLSRLLTLNSLLSLLTTVAVASAFFALSARTRRRHWVLLCGIACGLGLLTKGPVILALVLPPVLLFTFLDGRIKGVRAGDCAIFFATTLGVAAPWYLWTMWNEPDFAKYFFWKHNLVRYVAPFDHAKPSWFYLQDCLLGMLPWSILLPWLLLSCGCRTQGKAPPLPPAAGYALLAFVWTFLFFSAAGSKRSGYILPAMPLLAFALGAYLELLLDAPAWPTRIGHFVAFGKLPIILSLFILAGGMAGAVVACDQGLLRVRTALILTGAASAASLVIVILGRKLRPMNAWKVCGFSAFVVLLGAVELVLPGYSRRFSMREQVSPLRIAASDPEVKVLCFPRSWDSVSFYLRRKDIVTFTVGDGVELSSFLRRHPHSLAFVKAGRALELFSQRLPAWVEFLPQGRQGNVVAGWVRPRHEVPTGLLVGRRAANSR